MTDPFETLDDVELDTTVSPPADGAPKKQRRDAGATLNIAMAVYIFVNLIFALPLVIFPESFFDTIGLDTTTSSQLGGLRWMGAVLLAWAVSGIIVLARPGGRAIFVTSGALQLTFGALGFLYSWSIKEFEWSSWYHITATAILVVGAVVLWWARFVGRRVFKPSAP